MRMTVGEVLRKEGWGREAEKKNEEEPLGFAWGTEAVKVLVWETSVWVKVTG